ncbi:MAG: hypothetical protein ACXABF_13175, partial [Candidatus Thorarchaeota archaeon]
MPTVICKNNDCDNEYYVKPHRVKKGLGKYCSKTCYYIGRKRDTEERNRPNTVCFRSECDNEYYVSSGERNDGRGRYCCHKCYGLDKKGKKLSEEHKQKIGKATKRMWEDGVFDAPHIREAYAKQGRSTKGSKRTEEQKKAMSESRKGMDVSQLHTPEAREKSRQKLLGKKQTPESNKKRSNALKGREFTEEHRQNLSIAGKERKDNRGENSHWWRGGVADNPYPEEFTRHLKRKIRKRDNYECQCCE